VTGSSTKTKILLGGSLTVGTALFLAVLTHPLRPKDTLARIHNLGTLRVGYAITPPHTFLTPDGHPTGESVQLVHRVASSLGIQKVEWLLTSYGSLADELIARRFDLVACGTFPSTNGYPEIIQSTPTLRTHSTLLVQNNNPLLLHSTLDLIKHPTARVAVISQSTQESRLLQNGFPNNRLVTTPNTTAGHALVRLSAADAFLLPQTSARWIQQKTPSTHTQIADPFSDTLTESTNPPVLGGFIFLKSDANLLQAWNHALENVLKSKEYHRVSDEFGLLPDESPATTP
jgi:polar amino acid transport system substrate-binding protein